MGKRVFITGAGGFIGANLVRALLKRGDEVHILRRPESFLWRLKEVNKKLLAHNIELSDSGQVLKLLKDIQPEQVYHLAQYGCNPGENDPDQVRKVIIQGTGALFDACAQVPSVKGIVNIGSALEYGNRSVIMKEEMRLEPTTPYGCAKAWTTHYGQHLARQSNVPIVTLRPFFVFGPWQPIERFMPAVILSSLRGQKPQISNPNIGRDFIFVEDVVRAMMLAGDKHPAGAVINIGAGKEMTLKKAADIILKETGSKIKIETGVAGRIFDKPSSKWQADISQAKKLIGWKPKFSQKEGIIKTIKWFNENQNLYKTR